MEKKSFWNDNILGYFIKNTLIAITIVVGLVWATLIMIDFYTNHGKTEKVPDLKGLSMEQAVEMLDRNGLKFEIIDSVFVKDKKLGTIIEQTPTPNTLVKPGRAIYLIINSSQVRQVTIPAITDVSVRQAEAMLKSLGINVSTVEYAPSDYKDLVIDIKYRGQSVVPGTRIPDGSSVILVAGNGYGGSAVLVPSITGMDLTSASQIVNSSSFILGGLIYDVEPNGDEDSYIIYHQRPEAGDSIPAGSRIDVWLSKDRTMMNKEFPKEKKTEEEKVQDIEDFF